MDEDLKKIEAELFKLTPNGMPEDLLQRLDQAMCRWHESVPVEEKVVPLFSSDHSHTSPLEDTLVAETRRSLFRHPLIPAAAAIALLGAVVATKVSPSLSADQLTADNNSINKTPQPQAAGTVSSVLASRTPANNGRVAPTFVSTSATSNIVKTSDQGIVYLSDGQPARCLTVQYQDQMDFINDKGESLRVNKPDVQVIYFPLKTD